MYQAICDGLVPQDHVCGHDRMLVVVVLDKVLVRHALLFLDQDRAFDHVTKASGSCVSGGEARISLHRMNLHYNAPIGRAWWSGTEPQANAKGLE